MSIVRRRRRAAVVRPGGLAQVQELESRRLLATFQVTNANDSGSGSLRDAIALANASGGADTITFAIGTGAKSIVVNSALPDITDVLTIDGTTQPGYSGRPIVEINGAAAGTGAVNGLSIKAPANLKGLVVNRFSGHGVFLSGASGSTVKNCYIGTNLAGNAAAANAKSGIQFEGASNCLIGGPSESDRNVISGNGGEGVYFFFFGESHNNLVQNNYIGLDATGSFKVGNGAAGVQFFATARFNVVRDNVISGNNSAGVGVFGGGSTDTSVINNRIGTNAAGTQPVPNSGSGVDSFGSDRFLVQDNLISGNGGGGVTLAGGDFIKVYGNKIGVDVTGQLPMGNSGSGVDIGKVGGDFTDVRIGGLGAGEGNIIANNGTIFDPPGVAIGSSAKGVLVLSNSIYNNNNLGIDLNWDKKVTDNDAGDADTGANGLQNFPVITAAAVGNGNVSVSGTLNSAPSTTYIIQLFSSAVADVSGYGEGMNLIGTLSVTTDSAGNASFSKSFAATVNVGDKISATATAPTAIAGGGMTSEFSKVFVSTAAPTTDLAVSLTGDTLVTSGNLVTYTALVTNNGPNQAKDVTLSFALPAGVSFVSATPSNYTMNNGVLTFSLGNINGLISSMAIVKVVPNAPGSITATATASMSSLDTLPSNNTATLVTTVDDRPGTFSLVTPNQTTVEAAGFVTVGIQRLNGSKGEATVTYTITPGTATPGVDYNASPATGTLTFADGETYASILIEVLPDDLSEGDETISIALSNPTGGTGLGNGSSGSLTITDNDPAPSVSVSDVRLTEGDSEAATATFTFTLSGPSARTTSFQYATGGGTATAGLDYLAASGTVVFAPGETSKTVTITVLPDAFDEADEVAELRLSNAVGLSLPATNPNLIIADDDPTPTLSIDDLTVREATDALSFATFTVSLSAVSGREVSVRFVTGGGTSDPGVDYEFTSGVVTFAPGVLTRTITVPIKGDRAQEPVETFDVSLSQALNTTIADAVGTVTILDNDQAPRISITPTRVNEPDTGVTASARFVVSLSDPSGYPITVKITTADSTAAAGKDYNAAARTITFLPGETSRFFDVTVNGDRIAEGAETFRALLSDPTNAFLSDSQSEAAATIDDNDGLIKLSVEGGRVVEGDDLPLNLPFVLSLSRPSEVPVSVVVSTADGSARAGADYSARTVTVTFAVGQTSGVVYVPVLGDRLIEGDEAFVVNLSGLVGVGVGIAAGKGTAVGIIGDNDKPGGFAIEAPVYGVAENVGSGFVDVTIVRTGGTAGSVTVPFATANGNALAGQDYAAKSGTVTFAPGQTKATVRISLVNDKIVEADESFLLNLGNPSNGATLGAQKSTRIVIKSDDRLPAPAQLVRATPKFKGTSLIGVDLVFSGDLLPSAATNVANYALRAPGKDKVLGNANDVFLPILSASYNASNRTVSLTIKPFKLTTPIQVIAKSSGLVDTSNQPLDGNRDGKPGADATALLSRAGATVQSIVRKKR